MIIEIFEKQVKKFAGKTAIETDDRTLTYRQLDNGANRVTHQLVKHGPGNRGPSQHQAAALLFEHGADMIIGLLAALKAGLIYVPLDVTYPENRLIYMLEHSESGVILTNGKNMALAGSLAAKINNNQQLKVMNIDTVVSDPQVPVENWPRIPSADKPAYILYTSGSTGKPKGVLQNHGNILYFIRNWSRRLSLSEADRITLFSSLSHDGSIPDIYTALLNGAALYPRNIKADARIHELPAWLEEKKITIWHSVPTLFRFFVDSLNGQVHNNRFPDLRFVVLGGEQVIQHDVNIFKRYFPHTTLANIYGQTESTVNSFWLVQPGDPFDRVLLGDPIDKTRLLIIDPEGGVVEDFGSGEILVASGHVAPGYWKDPESTQKVFLHDPHLGRLYRTGDFANLISTGVIEYAGRKDNQVKIRGFRVELGEIETVLLSHESIKEAVVKDKQQEDGEIYLCAYIVPGNPGISEPGVDTGELRDYLSAVLPDYMIPARFVSLEQMPLTPSNKIDREALPEPGDLPGQTIAPRDEIERKLAEIWAEILGDRSASTIGIDDNYFQLGGHSLKTTLMVSKIHQALDVEVPLTEVFEKPTIRGLGQFIRSKTKQPFVSIRPVEKKEYYPLSTAQMRIFVQHQKEPGSIAYNLPIVLVLNGKLDREKLGTSFLKVIRRHESLRTSFLVIDEKPVQEVHEKVEFEMEYYDISQVEVEGSEGTGGLAPLPLEPAIGDTRLEAVVIRSFIRPLDLSRAPVLKAGLIRIRADKHILMINMSHIISDGASNSLLIGDLVSFYKGEAPDPLPLHYKDFSAWQRGWFESREVKKQEEYWLNRFAEQVPVLKLPTDSPTDPGQNSRGGDMEDFSIAGDLNAGLQAACRAAGVTTFMFLLAVYNIFLSWCTGQEDIVVGFPVSGRKRSDLQHIIGMFVNLLAIRNHPRGHKTFEEFLEEVKENAVNAYENQDYQYEELVKKLGLHGNITGNALIDAAFSLQDIKTVNNPGDNTGKHEPLRVSAFDYKKNASPFDLHLMANEGNGRIDMGFQYPAYLFKKSTIRDMSGHFMEILSQVLENPGIKLNEIKLTYDLVAPKLMNIDDNRDFDF
jgi:amino acid adenylation domain-containing protein